MGHPALHLAVIPSYDSYSDTDILVVLMSLAIQPLERQLLTNRSSGSNYASRSSHLRPPESPIAVQERSVFLQCERL